VCLLHGRGGTLSSPNGFLVLDLPHLLA
jgi:hypothetical protein